MSNVYRIADYRKCTCDHCRCDFAESALVIVAPPLFTERKRVCAECKEYLTDYELTKLTDHSWIDELGGV